MLMKRVTLGTGTQRSVAWTLQQSVRVQCGSNHLTASLPRPMAEALGVVGLFLNDRSCLWKRNATHWMVKTHVTSCGSTSRIDGKLTTYSNAVIMASFFFFFANWSLKGRKLRYSTKEFCLRHFCRSKFSWDPSSSIRTTMKILRAPGSMDMCRQLDKSPYPSSVTRNLISPSVLGTRWMTTTSWYVAFHMKLIFFELLKLSQSNADISSLIF